VSRWATTGQFGEQVRHQLGDVVDVVAQRRHLDRAREAGEQRREVGGRIPLGARDRGDHPRPLDARGLAVGLERVGERGDPGRGQPVEVGDHERAGVFELAGHLGDPLRLVRVGVEHAQVGGRGAVAVGGARERGLPDPRLAFEEQPLPGPEVPVHGLSALAPRGARPDGGGQGERAGRCGDAALRLVDGDEPRVQHPAAHAAFADRRPAVHPCGEPAGQVDHQPALPAGGQRLHRLGEQGVLVPRVELLARAVVHHQHVGADREHGAPGAAAGPEVVLQQQVLAPAGVREHGLLDPPADRGDRGGHHGACVAVPAGDVDDAEHTAGARVPDGDARAGEVLQVLDVVLVAEHLGGAAALEGAADAVGADVALRVVEAGPQQHAVEVLPEARVLGAPVDHHAVRVAEDHAHRLGGELVGDVGEHRARGAGEQAVRVDVVVGQFDVVRRDLPGQRAGPGGQDRLPDQARPHRLVQEERHTSARHVLAGGHCWGPRPALRSRSHGPPRPRCRRLGSAHSRGPGL